MSAETPADGWELSDSEDEEDIFQLTIQASVELEEEVPGDDQTKAATIPSKQKHHRGESSPLPTTRSSSQPSSYPRGRRVERNNFGRRGDFFGRRGNRQDFQEEPYDEDDGSDLPRQYSMPFPKAPPFCAWFGNVASDVDDLEGELYGYFGELGLDPKEIRFGKPGSHNKTCCFVDFEQPEDLREALIQIDCENAPRFYDFKLLVDIAAPRPSGAGGGMGRFNGRIKRRGRHSNPMSVGSDEFHSHVNNNRVRRRPPNSPPRGRGMEGFGHRRGGRGGAERRSHHDRRHHDSGPVRPVSSRNVSSESAESDLNYERRRSERDRDAYKVNGPTRDRFDGTSRGESIRQAGISRRHSRHEMDEVPSRPRINPRQQRRAHPRENFNHTKHRGGSSRNHKSSGRHSSKSGNSRFSNMFG